MEYRKWVVLSLVVGLVSGCGSEERPESTDAVSETRMEEPAKPAASDNNPLAAEQQLIRDARKVQSTVETEVKKLEEALKASN